MTRFCPGPHQGEPKDCDLNIFLSTCSWGVLPLESKIHNYTYMIKGKKNPEHLRTQLFCFFPIISTAIIFVFFKKTKKQTNCKFFKIKLYLDKYRHACKNKNPQTHKLYPLIFYKTIQYKL